jgi:rubredoxin
MNWHLPVDDTEALELKQFLVRTFDQNDISTYGLTFGISNDPGKRSHFSSVILEKNTLPAIIRDYDIRPTYNVLHFKNFDPNTQAYQVYAQDVDKIELPGLLMELSKKYFKQLGSETKAGPAVKKEVREKQREVFQCTLCLTVYDPVLGDEKSGIDAGTTFKDLPESYRCSVCEADISAFEKKSLAFT